jgi:hypothetical protein
MKIQEQIKKINLLSAIDNLILASERNPGVSFYLVSDNRAGFCISDMNTPGTVGHMNLSKEHGFNVFLRTDIAVQLAAYFLGKDASDREVFKKAAQSVKTHVASVATEKTEAVVTLI